MRRRTATTLAAATTLTALALASLTGCGSSAGGDTSLSFLMWGDGGDTQKAYEKVIEAFEAENPGVTVNAEFVNTNDYDNVLKTRLSGGAGPDVYGFDPKNIDDFVRDGFATDLSGAEFFGRLDDAAAQEARRGAEGDAAYSVPISQSGNGIVYNAALFAQAGITEVPRTYDELKQVAQRLKDAGITPFAMSAQDSWWPQFIAYYAMAQHVFPDDPDAIDELLDGERTFADTPGYAQALEVVKDLVPYYMPDPLGTNQSAAKSAFLTGQAAMFPATWILSDARAAGVEPGYMNFPTVDADVPDMWGSYLVAWGVNPGNDRVDAAERFIDFFFQDEVYTEFLTSVKAFPTTTGIDVTANDPLFPDMVAAWEGKTFRPVVIPAHPQLQETLLVGMQNLIAGRTDVGEVIGELDAALEEIRANAG
ncbi:ABC transporter substrate-binding protein [Microbacterium trichothecenolyticum]|uniref:Raffinose/stachyose/melibiose transport system substrate-binding protein n=1 Tax=Microbacterium trichothecenolyticum TaxID=69370 RepID=A0ABU0TV46_MICTR|nr:extracellular solute-binding protein [Microbacterium trichothecenolyticum]MDQ1123533.1 raffinose/stachyose/melibiose transport system substrate-binding protein [Microbacterium trichothecenolyticum]